MSTIATARSSAGAPPRARARSRAASSGSSSSPYCSRASSRSTSSSCSSTSQLDGLSRERAQLKADNALHALAAVERVGERAHRDRGGVEARARRGRPQRRRPTSGSRRDAATGGANHRIRLLVLAFARVRGRARPRGLGPGRIDGSAMPRWPHAAARDDRDPGGTRHDLDRTGEPLAIGEQATTVYADPRNIVAPRRAAIKAGETLGIDPNASIPGLSRPDEGVRLRRPQGRPGEGEAPQAARDPGDRVLPRGAPHLSAGARRRARPRLRRDGQPRARRARALARQDARRTAGLRDGRQGSVRSGDRRRHLAQGAAGQERRTDARPSAPGERRAAALRGGSALEREGRDRDRDGSANGCDPRDGERPDVRRERLLDRAARRAPQPRRHRPLRARLDVQDRDDRRRARGQRRLARDAHSRSPRRSRSPTA